MSDWTQYDSEKSVSVLKRIVNQPSKENEESCVASCVALLEAAKDSATFVKHIETLIEENDGQLHLGHDCPEFEKMCETEFKGLSRKVSAAHALWNAMSEMSPIDACRPGLWLYVTLNAIKTRAIESHYLAAGSNGDTGLACIDKALKNRYEMVKSGSGYSHRYLYCSRWILRRTFGAISQRGLKAIPTDAWFARFWWQRYLAKEIEGGGAEIPADDMMDLFHEEKGVYEELTMRMVSSLTVIGDKSVRDGLMHFFFYAHKSDTNDIKKSSERF